MKLDVERGIEQLRQGLAGHRVRVKEDPAGGAFVIVEDLCIGSGFDPALSWVGFHMTFPYPDADVYPHFIDAAVTYAGERGTPNQHPDGNLPLAMTRGARMPGFDLDAIQVSRSSNRRDAATDTALQKLLRVLEFLRTR